MSTGKKWTLKITKQDDADQKCVIPNYNHAFGKQDFSTPGPVYETHYIRSICGNMDSQSEKKVGNFGISRNETIDSRLIKAKQTKFSVSPDKYYYDYTGKRVKLSQNKTPLEWSIPRKDRGLLNTTLKVDGPHPQYYANTNELSRKLTLHNPGRPGLPNQERTIDFVKYSSVHKELVEKGIY